MHTADQSLLLDDVVVSQDVVRGEQWYVVQTKPKQESRADANLRRWGVETFGPLVREARVRRGSSRAQYRASPLFPGYIFARFDAADLLSKIQLTRGVYRVVGFGEYATPIGDEIIALIRSRVGEDGFVRHPELQPGDPVQVTCGPLRSLEGIFERHTHGEDRVLILLAAIGRAELPGEFVRKRA